jgi:hypothetical protein
MGDGLRCGLLHELVAAWEALPGSPQTVWISSVGRGLVGDGWLLGFIPRVLALIRRRRRSR